MAKGFGKSQQPSNLDKLVKYAVNYCQQRVPESLDKIFGNIPSELSQQVTKGILASLQQDIDAKSWFCGYMASEIVRFVD